MLRRSSGVKTKYPHSSKHLRMTLRSGRWLDLNMTLLQPDRFPNWTFPTFIMFICQRVGVVQYYSMVNKFGSGESHAVLRHSWRLLYLVAIFLMTSKAIIEKCGHVCTAYISSCLILTLLFITFALSHLKIVTICYKNQLINNLFIYLILEILCDEFQEEKFPTRGAKKDFSIRICAWMRKCWRQSSSEIRPSGLLLDHSVWNRQKNEVNTLWVDLMGQATCEHRLKGCVDIILRLQSILLKLSRKCWTNQRREFTLVPCQSCYFHVRTAPGPKPN